MSENSEHDVAVTTQADKAILSLEEAMPYAHKQEKALKIARRLLYSNDLQRQVELEVVAEDDKVMADMIENKLVELEIEQQQGLKHVVHTNDDVEKLPPGSREAVKHFINQLGGIPQGGLFQVKLDSVNGMDTAVDTIIDNGALNLGTVVCSKLASDKSARIAASVCYIVEHAHTLKEKGKLTSDDKKMLERIDVSIKRTFGIEKDYNCAVALCKELLKPEKKKKAVACKPQLKPRKNDRW